MLTSRNSEFQGGQYSGYQAGIAPTSVLIPYMKSSVATNTSSRTDQGRATISGQLLPSGNSYAQDTYSRLFTGTPTKVGF